MTELNFMAIHPAAVETSVHFPAAYQIGLQEDWSISDTGQRQGAEWPGRQPIMGLKAQSR